MTTPTITDLFVYPIKSCRGIPLSSAAVSPTGFHFDRHWMITTPTGRFLSQRQNPRLALIQPQLPPEALSLVQGSIPPGSPLPSSASLTISAPGMPPLQVPLLPSQYQGKQHPVKDVGVWQWSWQGRDAGPGAAQWLEQFLGAPHRLVRFVPGESVRGTDEYSPGFDLSFTDEVPYMVISKASLRQLNTMLPQGSTPVRLTRFRPNFVLDGGEAFEEDRWREFAVGGVKGREFRCVKPRARCKITTVDQDTAEVGSEPLSTLRSARSGVKLGLSGPLKFGGYFGMNTVCFLHPELRQASELNHTLLNVLVGQEVEVLRWAASPSDDIGTLWGA